MIGLQRYIKGSAASGNHGHTGRAGKRGGSANSSGSSVSDNAVNAVSDGTPSNLTKPSAGKVDAKATFKKFLIEGKPNFYNFKSEEVRKKAAASIAEEYERLASEFPGLKKVPLVTRLNIIDGESLEKIGDRNRATLFVDNTPHFEYDLSTSSGLYSNDVQQHIGKLSLSKLPANNTKWEDRASLVLGQHNVSNCPKDVFRHEYGHHVIKSFSSGVLDLALNTAFYNVPKLHDELCKISLYAASSNSEAFAECFATYTHPDYKKGTIPAGVEKVFIDFFGKHPNMKTKDVGLSMIFKHGNHDQRTHGHRGYLAGLSPSEIAKLAAKSEVSHPESLAEMPNYLFATESTPLFKVIDSRLKEMEQATKSHDILKWSLDLYTDADGKLSPERKALHDKIALSLLNDDAVVSENVTPKAVFLMGPSGAGKGYQGIPKAIKLFAGSKFSNINSDDAKEKLPEYQGWNASALHKESSMIGETAISMATAKRHNILNDTTGANTDKVCKAAAAMIKMGYEVNVVIVVPKPHIPPFRCWDRFLDKSSNGSYSGKGRLVSPRFSHEIVDSMPLKTLQEMKKRGLITHIIVVDSSTDARKSIEDITTDARKSIEDITTDTIFVSKGTTWLCRVYERMDQMWDDAILAGLTRSDNNSNPPIGGLKTYFKGSADSGNHGHAGREGEVGGSVSNGTSLFGKTEGELLAIEKGEKVIFEEVMERKLPDDMSEFNVGGKYSSVTANYLDVSLEDLPQTLLRNPKTIADMMENYKVELQEFAVKANKADSQRVLLNKLAEDADFGKLVDMDRGGDLSYSTNRSINAREEISCLVRMWTTTSGDTDMKAIAMQKAASEMFLGSDDKTLSMGHLNAEGLVGHVYGSKDYIAGEKKFLQAQYDMTQAYLKEKGIKELIVYRGHQGQKSSIPTGEDIDVTLQPLSSFSLNYATAISFSKDSGNTALKDHKPTVMATVVPAHRVFSLPNTGIGCTDEQEVVVIGGKAKATVLSAYDHTKYSLDRMPFGVPVGEGAASKIRQNITDHYVADRKAAKKIERINVDAELENADWTKVTWELPEYGSDKFTEMLRINRMSLTKFKTLPVYKHALNSGEISKLDDHFIKATDPKKSEFVFRTNTNKYEAKFQKVMVKYFRDQEKTALAVINKSDDDVLTKADRFDFSSWAYKDSEWNKRLQKEGGLFIKGVYMAEGSRAWEDLSYQIADGLVGAFDIDNPLVMDYIDSYSYKFAQGINLTTVDMMKGAMTTGMEDGLGTSELSKLIRGIFDNCSKYRSQLIARTESIRASNGGAEAGYMQSGVVSGKEWLVTEDDRTCPFCNKMAGKVRKLNENYFNLGDKLTAEGATIVFDYEDVSYPPLHPGCRCTIVPLIAKEYQLPKSIGLGVYFKGNAESGNYGHSGRPELVGGSKVNEGMIGAKRNDAGKLVCSDGGAIPKHIAHCAIPPAWYGVSFNPDPNADTWVTATNSSKKTGRVTPVYVYNPKFTDGKKKARFARVRELDKKFDKVYNENERNLKSKYPLTVEHAQCSKLIMRTGFRAGGEDQIGEKKAYGASTLEGQHIVKENGSVFMRCVGKKGVDLNIEVENKEVADLLVSKAKAAGTNGRLFPDVNEGSLLKYNKKFDGGGFLTKDFRTLLATRTAIKEIEKITVPPSTEKEYKKTIKEVATIVSSRLGNTPTIALQSYIDPSVFSKWKSKITFAKKKKNKSVEEMNVNEGKITRGLFWKGHRSS